MKRSARVQFACLGLLVLVAACAPRDAAEPAGEAESDAALEQGAADAAPEVLPPQMPDTEIYLAPMSFAGGAPVIGAAQNITNHPGYDNQPVFTDDGGILYASEGASGRTDIWRYDMAAGAAAPLWETPMVSEYSPRTAPDGAYSYIQENEEGDVTRVHVRAPNSDEGAAVIDLAPLGYYAWLRGGEKLAVFYRGEPAELHLVDIGSGESNLIAENIDRALYAAPDGEAVYFTTPRGDDGFALNIYELASDEVKPLFDLPGAAADYAVFAGEDGDAFFSAEGTTLMYRAAGAADWAPVADLSSSGIANITRIAVSADAIAFVAEE